MINSLHHFEILTHSSKKLLNYFVKGYNFKLIATKETNQFNQYLVNSNSINFLITSLRSEKDHQQVPSSTDQQFDPYAYKTSLATIHNKDTTLFNQILSKTDTVYNAAFQVRDLDMILDNCRRHNVNVLRGKHMLFDENYVRDGYVECAIIESCVDGVAHSLFDRKNYKGPFLPGFTNNTNTQNTPTDHQVNKTITKSSDLTHFDHLTYATHANTSNDLIDWYTNIFNMKRFKIGCEESNAGLIVKTGQSGMNLKVINYWMCAEAGVEFEEKKSGDESFKFVIAEPLPLGADPVDADNNNNRVKKNQISIFLEENNGPGIQHIGLFSNDIVKSVQESKRRNLDIKYYATPEEYYKNIGKIKEMNNCGLDVSLLKDNHILLDTDIDQTSSDATNKVETKSYLLQVFTQPIFDKNTVFLELIQRVGSARGFGAGNIKALWNAVQSQINLNTKC